ncbi:MAG: hypothetical protein Q9213_004531 [Squamulea squamosa]
MVVDPNLAGTRQQDYHLAKLFIAAQGDLEKLRDIYNEAFIRDDIKRGRVPCGRATVVLTQDQDAHPGGSSKNDASTWGLKQANAGIMGPSGEPDLHLQQQSKATLKPLGTPPGPPPGPVAWRFSKETAAKMANGYENLSRATQMTDAACCLQGVALKDMRRAMQKLMPIASLAVVNGAMTQEEYDGVVAKYELVKQCANRAAKLRNDSQSMLSRHETQRVVTLGSNFEPNPALGKLTS